MRDYLIFAFSDTGCTVRVEHDGIKQPLTQLTIQHCRFLGIGSTELALMMHFRNEVYFPLKTPIPPEIVASLKDVELL